MDPNQNYDQNPQPLPPSSPPPPAQQPQPFNQTPQAPISSPPTPQAYDPSQPINKTNGFAIAGIILAFLLPLIGLIFSIIGLKKAKNYNGKGKTLSIVGIILSSVFLLISLLILPVLVITTINGIERRANEASQNAASNGELGATYTEKSGAYSIRLPKGWEIEQKTGSTNLTAFPKESTGDVTTTIYTSSAEMSAGETLDSIVKEELKTIKSNKGMIKSENDIMINGMTAREITGSDNSENSRLEAYLIILVKDGIVYRVVYGTSPERYNNYLPLFKESAQSFKVN